MITSKQRMQQGCSFPRNGKQIWPNCRLALIKIQVVEAWSSYFSQHDYHIAADSVCSHHSQAGAPREGLWFFIEAQALVMFCPIQSYGCLPSTLTRNTINYYCLFHSIVLHWCIKGYIEFHLKHSQKNGLNLSIYLSNSLCEFASGGGGISLIGHETSCHIFEAWNTVHRLVLADHAISKTMSRPWILLLQS